MADQDRLSVHARRQRFRAILERDEVTRPASVFDPVSARLAEAAGFETAVFGGSTACHSILGAPDLGPVTLSEVAEQAHRISRASSISFFLDADNGYGNSLSVIRTIEELEAAGASAVSIEDLDLPRPFGQTDNQIISVEEFEAKLRAAAAARQDPAFVIVGRTAAVSFGGIEAVMPRIAACNRAGVDMIFLAGGFRYSPDDLRRVAAATTLPLMGSTVNTDPAIAHECRVKIADWNHLAFSVTIKALADAYAHTAAGRPAAELRERATSPEADRVALAKDAYDSLAKQYLT